MQTTQPVISVGQQSRMFHAISKESGQPVIPSIDIFADGRCLIRTYRGEELERRLPKSAVRDLLVFFERQGLFQISDESITRAIGRELQPIITELPDGSVRSTSRGPVVTVDGIHTRIAARTSTQKVEISRYAMHSELEHYRSVTELQTVQRCIQRVYEVAGKID